jgi:hypothetical protein
MNCNFRDLAALLLGLIGLVSPTWCQGKTQHPTPEKLGEVSFPVSCLPAVQKPFNLAVALLHSFAYDAAEKHFHEIAEADPKCAMAHWGVAMSYYHQMWEPPIAEADLERGETEIQKAKLLGGGSARENEFIEAAASFYGDGAHTPHRARAMAYREAMGKLASHNPDEIECQVFYALALLSTASAADRSHADQKEAANILEPLFQQYPQHPGIAHYLIHAYDNREMACQGLPAARAYAQIAPSAPHALHMPSHIFTQLGLWQDSIQSNLAARHAAHQQGDIGEELHAMDYLMYAYLQAGRYEEASRLLRELRVMPELPMSQFKVGYAATAMPVRMAIERRQWAEAAKQADPERFPVPEMSPPQVQAIVNWSHAVGAARFGKAGAAAPYIERLGQLLVQVRENNDDYWAAQVEIQIGETNAWVAHARGKQDDALALMRAAAEKEDGLEKRPITPGPIVPAREQLGDLLLELNQPGQALREFEAALEKAPRRRGGLSGALRAAKLSGEKSKAAQFQAELSSLNESGASQPSKQIN